MKVMIFTFSNTTNWWRFVASRLRFATETVLVSDLNDADIDISPAFHSHMARPGIDRVALDALGEEECRQVIARCRLLRTLEHGVALRMIGAMWRTIEDLLDAERPSLFLCFVVDRYILDLFDRALSTRGVRYIGLAIGILPDTFMFMARGEYLVVREPPDLEVEAAVATLSEPHFVPNYVAQSDYGLIQFLRRYAHFTARWIAFEVLRVVRRRPYDYRYLSARSAASGFRVRLRDWRLMTYFGRNWRRTLETAPPDKRVFVALSVNPEAAIEYWLRDLAMVDYPAVLERLVRVLGDAGYRLFVKDHPSQFGFRQVELFNVLARNDAVTFVPYDVPGQWLVDHCHATFTWTGTIGFQAAMSGRCAVVSSDAYYFVDRLFVGVATFADIDDLPRRIFGFRLGLPLAEARRALTRHILRSTMPGAYLSWRRFSPSDPELVRQAQTIVDSLNRYLPLLAGGTAA